MSAFSSPSAETGPDQKPATVDPASTELSKFHLALLPVMLTMPLLYWPQIVEFDAQPWLPGAAVLAAIFFWPKGWKVEYIRDYLPIAAALGCMLVYYLRETDLGLLLRYIAVLGTFIALWATGSRGGQSMIGTGVRIAIVLWFAVGLYQTIAIRIGLPIEFFGRFVAFRGGVPSLTAEPSFYGSISVLQLMYIMGERQHSKNWPYYVLAAASVFISGSILSYLLLLIPLARLPRKYIALGALFLLLMFAQGARVGEVGFFNRFESLLSGETLSDPLAIVQRDASTNLRVGHVQYTLVDGLPDLLLYRTNASFERSYNNWAFSQRGFIYNDSEFILTSFGELVFRTGLVGFALGLMLLWFGTTSVNGWYSRLEKFGVILLCLLSPVSLSNPFFIFYIQQRSLSTGRV